MLWNADDREKVKKKLKKKLEKEKTVLGRVEQCFGMLASGTLTKEKKLRKN